MTYAELLEELNELSSTQLQQDVTVHLVEVDEFVPVYGVCVAVEAGSTVDTTDVLDDDHIVLAS